MKLFSNDKRIIALNVIRDSFKFEQKLYFPLFYNFELRYTPEILFTCS